MGISVPVMEPPEDDKSDDGGGKQKAVDKNKEKDDETSRTESETGGSDDGPEYPDSDDEPRDTTPPVKKPFDFFFGPKMPMYKHLIGPYIPYTGPFFSYDEPIGPQGAFGSFVNADGLLENNPLPINPNDDYDEPIGPVGPHGGFVTKQGLLVSVIRCKVVKPDPTRKVGRPIARVSTKSKKRSINHEWAMVKRQKKSAWCVARGANDFCYLRISGTPDEAKHDEAVCEQQNKNRM